MIIIDRNGCLVETLNEDREVAILFNQCRLKVSNGAVNNLLSLSRDDGAVPALDIPSALELARKIGTSEGIDFARVQLNNKEDLGIDLSSEVLYLIGSINADREYTAGIIKAGHKTDERAWLMFLLDSAGKCVTFYVLGCITGFTQYTWKLKESIGELFYHNKEYFLTGGAEDV